MVNEIYNGKGVKDNLPKPLDTKERWVAQDLPLVLPLGQRRAHLAPIENKVNLGN